MAAKRVQESEYSRYYGAFRGVDFSNDESQVSPARFSYARNMYKDYDSGQGVAVETIAGFRMRGGFGGRKIYGIHKSAETGENGESVYYVHCGTGLYRSENFGVQTLVFQAMNEHFSKSFVLYGRLYILDGANYLVVKDGTVENVKDAAPYIPTTYINIIASGVNANAGTEYEQRNILSPYFKNTFIFQGNDVKYELSEPEVDDIVSATFYGFPLLKYNTLFQGGAYTGLMYDYYDGKFMLCMLAGRNGGNLIKCDPEHVQVSRLKVKSIAIKDGSGELVKVTLSAATDISAVMMKDGTDGFLKSTQIYILDTQGRHIVSAEYMENSSVSHLLVGLPTYEQDLTVSAGGQSYHYDTTDVIATTDVKRATEDAQGLTIQTVTDGVEREISGQKTPSGEVLVEFKDSSTRTMSFALTSEGFFVRDDVNDKLENSVKYYPSSYAGIEVTAKKTYRSLDGTDLPEGKDVSAAITGCTEVAIFDGRVFLTGNPLFPNSLFYCSYNNVTGYADPTYFGVLNRVRDGFDATAITGMIPLGDTLMTLKENSEQDGIIYYHTPTSGGNDLTPTVYPSKQGAVGAGCIAGACANFNDEPVFLTRLGLRAVTKLSTNLERSIEERSSLINNKLLKSNLKNAQLAEWNGYLCILVDGDMYMADSRQRYQDEVGRLQYEWYYISKLGQYEGQFDEYRYSGSMPEEFAGATVQYTVQGMQYEAFLKLADAVYFPDLYVTENLCGQVANEPFADGGERIPIYSAEIEGKAVSFVPDASDPRVVYLCETKGTKIGGRFCPATVLKSLDGNIFFGTENGYVYSFNFDLRDGEGKIPINAYNFDGRAIECGIATVMDNCGIPHMTKTTVKHSTVLKTKAFKNSCIKFKVRTNDNAYKAVQTVNSGIFSFDDVDFSDLTFNVDNKTIFAIREKEKRWVEKQYYLYSDEPNKPFGVYNAAFRYRLAGRYKS